MCPINFKDQDINGVQVFRDVTPCCWVGVYRRSEGRTALRDVLPPFSGLRGPRMTYVYLCVLCGAENKQPSFPYTILTDWFL